MLSGRIFKRHSGHPVLPSLEILRTAIETMKWTIVCFFSVKTLRIPNRSIIDTIFEQLVTYSISVVCIFVCFYDTVITSLICFGSTDSFCFYVTSVAEWSVSQRWQLVDTLVNWSIFYIGPTNLHFIVILVVSNQYHWLNFRCIGSTNT